MQQVVWSWGEEDLRELVGWLGGAWPAKSPAA